MKDNNLQQLKNYMYICIISADNDEFGLSEADKQDIIHRWNPYGDEKPNWKYILEPIKDESIRRKLIEFFENE